MDGWNCIDVAKDVVASSHDSRLILASSLMYYEDAVAASSETRFVTGSSQQSVVVATARHGPCRIQ